jgi:hypothetical protein
MNLELVISEVKPQAIVINNKYEILKALDESLVKYNKVLTEDNMKEGKEDRAKLNKLVDAIDSKRKEVKEQCLAPYTAVEKDFKEITGKVEKVKDVLDKQIKNYEQSLKDKKKKELQSFYDENVGDLGKLIKFEQVFNEKMLNATYSQKVAEEEIKDFINKVTADLKVIESLNTEFENQLKDYYLKQFDMSKTLQEKSRLEVQKLALEQVKNQSSEIIQEEPKKVLKQVIQKRENEEILLRAFKVWGTKEQIIALSNFMNENNIKFNKIEGEN